MGFATAIKRFWEHQGARAEDIERNSEDARIQLNEVADRLQKKHRQVLDHASNVIAAKTRVQQKLNDVMAEHEQVSKTLEAAVSQATSAETAGNADLAAEKNSVAQALSEKLDSLEAQMQQFKMQLGTATENEQLARKAVKVSEGEVRDKLNQIAQDHTDLDQAKMQQELNSEFASMNNALSSDDDLTLDSVHDRIQKQLAKSGATSELTGQSEQMKEYEVTAAMCSQAAQDRIAKIKEQQKVS